MTTEKIYVSMSKTKVSGMYLTDMETLDRTAKNSYWVDDKSLPYLPILNLLQLSDTVKLADPGESDGDVDTYNQHTSPKSFSVLVTNHSKMVISSNDLLLGDQKLILNFTNMKVTGFADSGGQKDYAPLSVSKLERFRGKMLIIYIYTMNSPIHQKTTFGVENYFESLLDIYKVKNNPKDLHFIEQLEFVKNHWTNTPGMSHQCKSNTIKVVSVREITETDLSNLRDGKIIRFPCCRTVMKRTDTHTTMTNPNHEDNFASAITASQGLRAHGMSCYIVDNSADLKPRFYNFLGAPMMIPRVVNTDLPEGLYIASTDSSVQVNQERVIGLKDIEKHPYIYDSRERASVGADITTQQAQQHQNDIALATQQTEMLKAKNQQEQITSTKLTNDMQADYKQRLQDMEFANKQALDQQAELSRQAEIEHKRALHEQDIKHKRDMADITTSQSKQESVYDAYKFRYDTNLLGTKGAYETQRYERDTTVETIKTAGSLAALAIAGVMAYNRFSK